MAELILLRDDVEVARLALGEGEVTIGRRAESDLVIDSSKASRTHARVLPAPGGWVLEDAGSANGCFLGSERIGRHPLRDGDRIQIVIDRNKLEGSVDLIGDATGDHNPAWGTSELSRRAPRPDLAPDPALPADTRLWAALQHASGGVWGGCVYDAEVIAAKLR